jgi:hypothetical protein
VVLDEALDDDAVAVQEKVESALWTADQLVFCSTDIRPGGPFSRSGHGRRGSNAAESDGDAPAVAASSAEPALPAGSAMSCSPAVSLSEQSSGAPSGTEHSQAQPSVSAAKSNAPVAATRGDIKRPPSVAATVAALHRELRIPPSGLSDTKVPPKSKPDKAVSKVYIRE